MTAVLDTKALVGPIGRLAGRCGLGRVDDCRGCVEPVVEGVRYVCNLASLFIGRVARQHDGCASERGAEISSW